MSRASEAERRLAAAGQETMLAWLRGAPAADRERLRQQILGIDFDLLRRLHAGEGMEPPPAGPLAEPPFTPANLPAGRPGAREAGEEALRAGRVAFVLVAGGQASRLRWRGPKGTFPIGPRTDRSLFQVLAERIVRAGRRYGMPPPLAVTTSEGTDAEIRAFFQRHGAFGLPDGTLSFAAQGELPALDGAGQLLLARRDRIFTSPDGHGGALGAVAAAGLLDSWEERGIRSVCTFQVDNPLLPVVDPTFLGRRALCGAPLASKVILKREPGEKVGVAVLCRGKPRVLEYSEITPEQAAALSSSGALAYRLGSIGVHAFELAFLKRELEAGLPYHVARREIPCLDAQGGPTVRTARKFEQFIFDLFPRAERVALVEVLREREFAPLKNADGPDSPATVREALDREARRWYAEAGVAAPGHGPLELSPLLAEGPEDLLHL
ncbi:MAG: UTP--glucose-1-phosphate uridylyltransferase [Planctomycetaceae bacterium]